MSQKPATMTDTIRYHSHRPFLIVDIYRRPAASARTSRKGWGEDPAQWDVQENPYVVDRVATKHMRSASAIIDIFAGTLLKNRFSDASPADVYKHYTEKYAEKINQALQVWHQREGHRPAATAAAPSSPAAGITVTI